MRIALAFLTLSIAVSAAAQSRNAAYIEVGGNAVIPSINYERQLTESVYGRIGLGVVTGEENDGDDDVTFSIPLTVSYLTNPAGNHHFEAGGGLTLITGDSQDLFNEFDESLSNLIATGIAGYRYQKPGRGFVFRAGFTPIYDDSEILPWLGVSFGYRW